jgi:DNA-binding IclR family transcriptional regulator
VTVRSGGPVSSRPAPAPEPPVPEQSKTVDAALSLLTLLADQDGEPTAASLSRALGMSRTAVARMLATLEAHGLARRTDQGWRPGLGLLALAAGIETQLRALARTELEALAARFGETAVLTVRDGDEAVVVDQVVGAAGVVQVHYRTGTRHPVELGAGGRALRADGTGAVFSRGELEAGVRGVAAAVVGVDGRPQASVALVAPEHRFPDDEVAAAAVTEAARRISLALARDTPAPRPAPSPPPRPGGRDAPLPASR